ncbi:MAG: hypothetical protein HYV15_05770 [Elusimicrobia bacterium]|nr:hypothetical protein [Elusimicrobiota bacterium]
MNLLNLYFTPFAAVMVVSAIYFSDPDASVKWISVGVLLTSLIVNHWFSKNTYRFVGWAQRMKTLQVWLTFLWSAVLAYLLMPFWAPMWLLLTLPPVTAALYQSKAQTLGTAGVCSLSVLALYKAYEVKVGMPLGEVMWAQGAVHAAFIPVLAAFVHELAQAALRMRDASRP